MTHKILILSLFIFGNIAAQSLKEHKFSDYKSTDFTLKTKAKLDVNSSKTAKRFKTAIAETYKTSKIDFASYYITVIWGCGTGCINGAMVDVRDGKVYDLPLNSYQSIFACFTNAPNTDVDERFEINKNSRLFLTVNCEEIQNEKNQKVIQTKTYFVSIWDEKTKKFNLKKKINQRKTVLPVEN